LPDDGGEDGEDRPSGPEGGQGRRGRKAPPDAPPAGEAPPAQQGEPPIRVTPVKVVRWVPKSTEKSGRAHPRPPRPDEAPAPFDAVEEDRGAAPLAEVGGSPAAEGSSFVVLDEGTAPAPAAPSLPSPPPSSSPPDDEPGFAVVEEGTEAAFTEVPGEAPAPFEVAMDRPDATGAPPPPNGPGPQGAGQDEGVFTVVDDGGEGAPVEGRDIQEVVEMERSMELREEESTVDIEELGRPRQKVRPAPPPPTRGPSQGAPPPPRAVPTVKGIPIAQGAREPPRGRADAPPPPPAPQKARVDEPAYAKYLRPDEDVLQARHERAPTGFDRDMETEAGELDIGIELDKGGDRWKREKVGARPATAPRRPGQKGVAGHDMDSEVGTRDAGPDIGVDTERRKKRRL
jgi:hypothetical protein